MFSPELLQVMQTSQRSLYRVNFGSGIVFIVLGLGAIVGGLLVNSDNGLGGFLIGLGVVMMAAGVLNCLYYRSRYVDLPELLTQRPEQVVWVYRRINTGSVSGVQVAQFSFIVFGLRDRRQIQVRLPAKALEYLLQQVPQVLPHATVGYTPEYAKQFRQNPETLIRPSS